MKVFTSTNIRGSLILKKFLWATLLLATVLSVQLPAINRPYLGHFSGYQNSVMAAIARNMLHTDFKEWFLPKIDLIIAGQKALHINQYPIPSLLAALGKRFCGGTLEFWGRFQAIIFNLIAILLMGIITARLHAPPTGWIAATIFALSPLTIIYGQCFMCESIAMAVMLLGLLILLPNDKTLLNTPRCCLAGFLFSIVLVSRIHFFIFMPCFIYLIIRNRQANAIAGCFCFLLTSGLIAIPWYGYTYFITSHFDNVLTSMFLQDAEWKFFDPKFLLNAEYWQRVFDTMVLRMLTPIGFTFLLLGSVMVPFSLFPYRFAVIGVLLGSSIVFIWPSKVMEHDFYLYGMLPFAILLAAIAVYEIWNRCISLRNKFTVILFFVIFLACSARFFLHPIFKVPVDTLHFPLIAEILQQEIKPDDKVVVFGANTPDLFYYLDRGGWSSEFVELKGRVPAYLKNSKRPSTILQDFIELEHAMKDPVAWVEYLAKHGVAYLITTNRFEIQRFPVLLKHLRTKYQERIIPGVSSSCYVFRLSNK